MNIIQKIKKSIEESTNVPFYYASAETLNIVLDSADYPCALAVLAEQGTITDVNGLYHERLTLVVSFADKTDFDFDSIENEDIIDRCKKRAFTWLHSLLRSDTLKNVSVNSTTRDYLLYDVILTGYGVNITLEEIEGFGACDIKQ